MPDALPQLLTMDEVGSILGKSARTLRDWNRRRLLSHVKVGGEDRYELSAVLSFISRNRRVARGEGGPALSPAQWGQIERLVDLAVERRLAAGVTPMTPLTEMTV